jgi:hypothetical protein
MLAAAAAANVVLEGLHLTLWRFSAPDATGLSASDRHFVQWRTTIFSLSLFLFLICHFHSFLPTFSYSFLLFHSP